MPSKARTAFTKNSEDVKRLLEIHEHLGGGDVGRRHRLEVLNKSAVVLITAVWEGYCEDLAAEAVEAIIQGSTDAKKLSLDLRKMIAKELEDDPHELAVWGLADSGWKKIIKSRLSRLQQERNWNLNTPKSGQIDDLFLPLCGVAVISRKWRVRPERSWPSR